LTAGNGVALITPNFVFIHVPRTGGTSTRAAILARFPDAVDSDGSPASRDSTKDACGVSIPPEQHIAASKLERRDHRYLTYKFVGFVRHPVSWYQSMWAWAMRTNFAAKLHCDPFAERHWLADVWSTDLNQFIDRVIALQVPRAWVVFHEKLTRDDGALCQFGRYEFLYADLWRLTGCSVGQRLRPSNDQKNEITRHRRGAIEQLERETINKFYSF
jgi:hypothetical protein